MAHFVIYLSKKCLLQCHPWLTHPPPPRSVTIVYWNFTWNSPFGQIKPQDPGVWCLNFTNTICGWESASMPKFSPRSQKVGPPTHTFRHPVLYRWALLKFLLTFPCTYWHFFLTLRGFCINWTLQYGAWEKVGISQEKTIFSSSGLESQSINAFWTADLNRRIWSKPFQIILGFLNLDLHLAMDPRSCEAVKNSLGWFHNPT